MIWCSVDHLNNIKLVSQRRCCDTSSFSCFLSDSYHLHGFCLFSYSSQRWVRSGLWLRERAGSRCAALIHSRRNLALSKRTLSLRQRLIARRRWHVVELPVDLTRSLEWALRCRWISSLDFVSYQLSGILSHTSVSNQNFAASWYTLADGVGEMPE